MKREAVDSSMIASVGYDKFEKILEVEFHSGKVYQYYNVDQKTCSGLIEADSKGRYMNAYIINEYRYSEVPYTSSSSSGRIAVDSSMIAEVAYDSDSETLELVYTTGAIWEYEGVEKEVYDNLLKADSIGRYVRNNIIGCYPEFKTRR